MLIKIEEDFNNGLRKIFEAGEISEEFFQRVRATGSQLARLYGLAKVHKENTPLRPVLSLPGSMYQKLNKELARLFQNVPGANIETTTPAIRENVTSTDLDDDEVFFL